MNNWNLTQKQYTIYNNTNKYKINKYIFNKICTGSVCGKLHFKKSEK